MKQKLILIILMICLIFSCAENIEQPKDYNIKDITYGNDTTFNKMDIYRTDDKTKPVVMLIHGGAWIDIALLHEQLGRSGMTDFKDQFLKNGYHVANIDYRLITIDNTTDTKVTYLDMLDDIKSAINYLKTNADKYSIDPTKVILYGYSAGGHLALLYSYKVTDSPIPVKLVVSRAGPTNFRSETFRDCDFSSMIDNNVEPSMKPMMLLFMQTLLGLPPSTSETETYNWCKLALITELLGISQTSLTLTKPISEILDDLININDISLDDASPIKHVSRNCPKTIMLYSESDTLVNAALADELISEFNKNNFTDYQYFKLKNSTHALDDNRDSAKIKEFNDAVIEKGI